MWRDEEVNDVESVRLCECGDGSDDERRRKEVRDAYEQRDKGKGN